LYLIYLKIEITTICVKIIFTNYKLVLLVIPPSVYCSVAVVPAGAS